jgi:hypothetical protein
VKRILSVFLGILTAIGGFVDIGDLVANALVGSRFGLSLAWATLIGVVGICVFAEMSARVAAVTSRGTFDIIRERLGPRVGLLNLVASLLVTLLTFTAEVGGVALALELATSVNYLLFVPVVGFAVWLVIWRVRFSTLENVFGLLGLALIVFGVALWQLNPSWGDLLHQIVVPSKPADEHLSTYFYYAIALFGAAMTPYEVFFFSSGGVEEHWKPKDIGTARANVFIGFPLGGLLSLSIAGCAALVLLPAGIQVATLGQVGLPVAVALGKIAGRRHPRLRRRDVRRRHRDRAVHRLRHRAVLRLAMGQIRTAAAGRPLPRPGPARRDGRGGRGAHDGRPDQGDRVLHRVLGRRPAADLLPDPGRRQRPGVHGAARQRPAGQRARHDLPRGHRHRRGGRDPPHAHHGGGTVT